MAVCNDVVTDFPSTYFLKISSSHLLGGDGPMKRGRNVPFRPLPDGSNYEVIGNIDWWGLDRLGAVDIERVGRPGDVLKRLRLGRGDMNSSLID